MKYLLEDGDEEVEEQYVGKQQVNTQHNDGQPFREDWKVVIIQHGTLGLQCICAIHSAAVYTKLCVWITKTEKVLVLNPSDF